MNTMKLLITGGGTGGHIYPALALIREIKKKDPTSEFLYVGTKNGLESKIVPAENIPFQTIEIQGFKRSLSLDTLKTLSLFIKSLKVAKKMIKKFQPDVVLGTGGYVSSAVVYAAYKLGIPTVIHEQNSVPGMTNKFLARYVDKVAICFSDAAQYFPKEKVVLTGNPRAQEVYGIPQSAVIKNYQLDPAKPTVLIFGGSRGAAKINQAVKEAITEFTTKNYQILYASGEIYYEKIQMELKEQLRHAQNITVIPYISDMEQVLANVTLIVGRAGATSLAEITALGLPSILIPSPNVTNDHQTKNAQNLVKNGAAVMLKDGELSGELLVTTIDELMDDPSKLHSMAKITKEAGIPDAADRLYELVKTITN